MNLFSFLNHFKTEYMNNHKFLIELEETIFQIESFEKWEKLLKTRSEKTREIYLKNDKLIEELKQYLKEDLTSKSAKAYYDVIHEMYDNECDDYAVMCLIIDKILPYYESKNDYGKLVKLYHVLAFECYESYGRTGKASYIRQACDWYKKVTSYKEYYDKIQDPDERLQIFIAYSNLIAPFGQIEEGTKNEIFDIYDEVIEFYNSDKVKLDRENEDFISHMEQINEDIFYVDENMNKDSEYIKGRFLKLFDEYQSPDDDLEGTYFRAKNKAELIRKEITPEELAKRIVKYILDLPLPDYDKPDDALLIILNYHNDIIDLYGIIKDYLNDDSYMQKVLKKVIKVHTTIPYSFYTQMMNNVCEEFYRDLHDMIKSFNEKLGLLLKLILVRQPTTYIHSLMVAEIASLIAKYMIDERPELFTGILGFDTKEDILNHKKEVLSYIEKAGLLHDVGKSFIVDIVNRQQRKLSDDEFSLIKEHPKLGLEMIENDEDFKDYFDIMQGHHKWFNDLGGYPNDFIKKDSKYHFYIDLITIADCTDAATDILGRNYTKGKDFNVLFQELVKDSGTRYNKEIVDFIGSHEALYKELSNLTGSGRAKIYYKAYQHILNND